MWPWCGWALIHLGIRANPPEDPGPPTSNDIDLAFRSFEGSSPLA